ncbi:LamG domain-containing protein [Cryobacterium frigoriphilum]|uniref:LamG domain-containing protein n=1 Tax=Cryobacterium frigoriphilum TaxID=1259150 RepID=A0A4R8ZXA1_9MICO|nr:LamG domain-containing protein [Cryobacterium frigoriphilum]TFD48315.1 LamG domain-containing protein [Cryobacterium frigoriphilum]
MSAHRQSRRRTLLLRIGALPLILLLASGVAWSYVTAGSVDGGFGASAATSVGAGNAPTVGANKQAITVSWAASTLASGAPVTAYTITRYQATSPFTEATVGSGCSSLGPVLTCTEAAVTDGSWTYTVTPRIGTNWVGAESPKSAVVVADGIAPVNAIAVTAGAASAYKAAGTIYYRGSAAGSFSLTNAVADFGSRAASSTTTALSGNGWTHTATTVSAPTYGPYVSGAFTWTAGTTASPTETVTGLDLAGNSTATTLTLVNDSTAPTGGAPVYGTSQSTRSVVITNSAADGGSGITTQQLQRFAAPLTSAGLCGSYGTAVNIGTAAPVTSYTDSSVSSGCYQYQYVLTDNVGNTVTALSSTITVISYAAVVATASLGQWRLGESSSATSSDTFSGTAGSLLTTHDGEVGAKWTKNTVESTTDAVFTDAGRIRKSGAATARAMYTSSGLPSSADYRVEADIYIASKVPHDAIGVVGRVDLSTTSYYAAVYYQGTGTAAGTWQLVKVTSNSGITQMATVAANLTAGQTYRIALNMSGSLLTVYVNGTQILSTNEGSITAAGRGGFDLGYDTVTTATNSTGAHLDNFQVLSATTPAAADSKGTNHGTYTNDVALGVAGAIANDSNTAAQFDGVNDYVSIARQVSAAFSIEFWFRSTQNQGSTATCASGWWQGAGLVDAFVSTTSTQDFGVSLCANGQVLAGTGTTTIRSAAGLNDGTWHHVVFTRAASGAGTRTLYVDGVQAASGAGTTAALTAAASVTFGRLQTGANYFAGTLDEVAISASVLGAADVSTHYSLGTGPVIDSVGPTGGSVDATTAGFVASTRYAASTALSIAFAPGTDASGLATSGATLARTSASLSNNVCGAYGSTFTTIALDPAPSPVSDTVTDQSCYRYRYTVVDTLGNSADYLSPDIKVDLTPPSTPTLTPAAVSDSYWNGSTMYYRSAATAGSFMVTAAATDAASGLAGYTFALPAASGWSSAAGVLGVNTYAWTTGATGTSAAVAAVNNAAAASASAGFALEADTTGPTAGSVSYTNGDTANRSVTVTTVKGLDGQSGLGAAYLYRTMAPLTGSVCGTYAAATLVATNPSPSYVDSTLIAGNCYRYQYRVDDLVGNAGTYATNTNVAVAHRGAYLRFAEASGTSLGDTSGNGNTGTLRGGTTWTTRATGNPALSFNGTGYVDIPRAVIDTSQSYTVSAWVKPASNTGYQTYLSVDGGAISPFYLQMLDGNFQLTLRSSDSTASTPVTVTRPTDAVAGTWYHLAGVYNKTANTLTLYVNGVSQGFATAPSVWTATGNSAVGRARWNGASVDYVTGSMDDAQFLDRALTSAEVLAQFNATR